jgi:archaellum component FlaC
MEYTTESESESASESESEYESVSESEPKPKSDSNKLDYIILLLHTIEVRIENIESHLGNIDEKSKGVEQDCSKMREHIQFIETTYEAVRKPLNYITNNIEYMMGIQGTDGTQTPTTLYAQQKQNLLFTGTDESFMHIENKHSPA